MRERESVLNEDLSLHFQRKGSHYLPLITKFDNMLLIFNIKGFLSVIEVLNKLGFLNDSDSSAPGDRVSTRIPPRRPSVSPKTPRWGALCCRG